MILEKSGNSNGNSIPENYQHYFVPLIGRPFAEDLIITAALKKGERILDVACGTGVVARLAAEQTGPEGKVEGLDINPGMLAVARSETGPDAGIEWHEASAESIPLADNSFDVVLCQMGLQFMTDKTAALREMHPVLDPHGRLVLNVPGPKEPVFEIMDKALQKYVGPEAAGLVKTVFSLYDIEEIKNMLIRAGFHDLRISQKIKPLHLPRPADFLNQYISSTPIWEFARKTDKKNLQDMEKEVEQGWAEFEVNGGMKYNQHYTMVTANK